jgi:putative ABC transport system ATP-binding protein
VAGQRIDALSETSLARYRRTQVGMIFQFFNLLDDLTVADNVLLPAQLAGTPRRQARARCAGLLDQLAIGRYRDSYPGRLSGGERQRVAIARALVTRPQLVLADEPTANLDSVTGAHILEVMRELNRTEKTTFIFSTHDQGVMKHAHAVVRLADGKFVDRVTPAEAAKTDGARV